MDGSVPRPLGRVVHRIPGRLRLKFDSRHVTPAMLTDVQSTLLVIEGVERCDAKPRSCSLVLFVRDADFADSQLDPLVQDDAAALLTTSPAPEQHDDPPTWLMRQIDVRTRLLDRRLRRATGDRVDLRTLLPIGFAALAVREIIVTSGQLPAIPWYVLLWYAFDSYLKLHGTPTGGVTQHLMEAVVDVAPAGE